VIRLVFLCNATVDLDGPALDPADSDHTVEIEGNPFPTEAIRWEYFVPSEHRTVCPWKGEAVYYHVKVGESLNQNAVWSYPEPKEAAAEIMRCLRMQDYDVIVIGAGQGGIPFAREAAANGRKTALIERKHVGGTCINEGCTPTKTMIASARVAHLAQRGPDYGVRTGTVEVDLERVRQRKRDIVESWRAGSEDRIEATDGLTLIRGDARFTAPHSLAVTPASSENGRQSEEPPEEELELSAPIIVIDAGTRPSIPPLPGLEDVPYLTSTSIMELAEVPEHLLILGGGYVAVEFGQMFRRFGSRVTIVERGPRLLSQEDEDVSEAVAEILREDGLEVLTESTAQQVRQTGQAGVELEVETSSGTRVLSGSHLLVATGRTPNTEGLNLESAGILADHRGFVTVDDRLESNVSGVYAIGDINGGPAFTHISYDDYRILKTNLLEGGQAGTEGRLVPYVVFIDPQLGRVGLNERQAVDRGHRFLVGQMPMSSVARALETDETRGLMKVIVDAETDEILGAAVLGLEGGEIMAILETAMLGKLPAGVLREAIFAHPTLAEAMNNLFGTLSAPSDAKAPGAS